MSIVFNPFTGNFDFVGSASVSSWKQPVTTESALPASGNTAGDVRTALDTGIAYEWSGSAWAILNGVYPTSVSGTSTPDGVSVDGANNLTLHVADATNPGLVSTTTQSFAGNKTFTGSVAINGAVTLTALQASTALVSDGSKDIISSVTTATELGYVSGVTSAIQTQLNATEKTANKGVANGYAPLDASTKIPASYLPSTVFEYQGAWNPSTNSPALSDGTGTTGYVYRVSTQFSGTVSGLADPSMTNFQVGNLVIYSGTAWQQTSAVDGVVSVNGAQGAVTVNAINQLTGDGTAGPVSGSASAAFTLAAVGAGGTFPKVTFNTKGLVTGGTALSSVDIPNNAANTTGTAANVTATSNNTLATLSALSLPVSQLTGTLPIANGGTNSATALTNSKVMVSTGGAIVESATTTTQLSYLDATSSIQTQLNSKANAANGDIAPSSFSASNNISSATNVTGLLFPSASVGSFQALVQVLVSASTNLRQTFRLQGSLNGAGNWQMTETTSGDESGFVFTITSSGQVQYVNSNYTGFIAATVRFRAEVLGI